MRDSCVSLPQLDALCLLSAQALSTSLLWFPHSRPFGKPWNTLCLYLIWSNVSMQYSCCEERTIAEGGKQGCFFVCFLVFCLFFFSLLLFINVKGQFLISRTNLTTLFGSRPFIIVLEIHISRPDSYIPGLNPSHMPGLTASKFPPILHLFPSSQQTASALLSA